MKAALKPVFCFLFIVLFIVGCSHRCNAEIFVRKGEKPAAEQADPAPQPPAPQSSAPTQAAPQTQAPAAVPDIREFARRYYQNCLSKQHPVLQGEPLQKLCACSAGKVLETMSVENIQAMATNTAEGQRQRDRMLLSVYVPCMEYPTQALIYNSCMENPEVAGKVPNHQQICQCAADETAAYVKREAPTAVAESLRSDPGNLDPLSGLMNSAGFQAASRQYLMGCLQKAGAPLNSSP